MAQVKLGLTLCFQHRTFVSNTTIQTKRTMYAQSLSRGPRVAAQTPWISQVGLRNLWSVVPVTTKRRARIAVRIAVVPMAISSFLDGVKKALGQVRCPQADMFPDPQILSLLALLLSLRPCSLLRRKTPVYPACHKRRVFSTPHQAGRTCKSALRPSRQSWAGILQIQKRYTALFFS